MSASLGRAELQYLRLMERCPSPIWIHDGRQILFANRAGARLVGGQLVGRPVADVTPASSLPTILGVDGQSDGGVPRQPTGVVVVALDGSPVQCRAVVTTIQWRDESIVEVLFHSDSVGLNALDAPFPPGAPQDAVVTVDHSGVVRSWSEDAHHVFGPSGREAIGMPLRDVTGIDLDACGVLAGPGVRHCTQHVLRPHAGAVTLRITVVAIAEGYVVLCTDRSAARRADSRLEAVLDALHEGVVIMSNDGHFEFTNTAARQMLGATAEVLVGLHHSHHAVDLPLYDERGHRISADSHPIIWIQQNATVLSGQVIGVDRLDGQRVWVVGHGCLLDPQRPQTSSVLFSFTDITDQHTARTRLLHEATHDGLTDLPNRAHAVQRATAALARRDADSLAAVLFIDLDKLKLVNDVHGHAAGDAVLKIASRRLESAMRVGDVLARVGGDEFVALLFAPLYADELVAVKRKMHASMNEPMQVGSHTVAIDASIGVAPVSAGDTRNFDQILGEADAAMYRAKAQRPGGPAPTGPM